MLQRNTSYHLDLNALFCYILKFFFLLLVYLFLFFICICLYVCFIKNTILDVVICYFRYARFNELKTKNPNLKTLLAVGGWTMASRPFTAMVASDASRRQFSTTTIKFLRDHNFDGLDLDWEYPEKRGSPHGDKQKYVELLKVLSTYFTSSKFYRIQ